MAHHVFTEDQTTMEWYIDGIPVAELKRRHEAHDALVKALENLLITWENKEKKPDWAKRFQAARDQAKAALDNLAAAEVRNG